VPLWFVSPLVVGLMVVGSIPAFFLQQRIATRIQEARQMHGSTDRLLQRLAEILTQRAYAAEIRLFGTGRDLVKRWRNESTVKATDILDAERSVARATVFSQLSFITTSSVALALTVHWIRQGQTDVGAWVVVLQGVQWAMGIMFAVPLAMRRLREQSAYLGELFRFEDEADSLIEREGGEEAQPILPKPTIKSIDPQGMAIVADNVDFTYPGVDRPVLRNVSLAIAPGEHVALVGKNGAGKSTLARLLTGLYLPSSGTVRLDELPTSTQAAASLRRDIGAVFQDFVEYQLTVRENIAFGDLSRAGQDDELDTAANQAGLFGFIHDLPDGYDSFLGRQFGVRDLSGGEWQSLALARAFFRRSRFLVLDEPTAALDPIAEQSIFADFANLAHGRTALMISHRLGPARFADRIIVMEDGSIIEQGCHDDLIAANGAYAHMYAAQAEWYR
jgi:ATP-binding cassette subfamily B protein